MSFIEKLENGIGEAIGYAELAGLRIPSEALQPVGLEAQTDERESN
jgi:hypothetical protein